MRGEWSFEKAQRAALKDLKKGELREINKQRYMDMISDSDISVQELGSAPGLGGYPRLLEACLLSAETSRESFLRRLHVCWRYEAFEWFTYIRRAEQLAEEFPKKAKHRSLPIGDIEVNNASCILRTMALAAVLGEDEAHDWFGNRCLQMIETDEPFVDPEAWTTGPVQPFLTWLFCQWRYSRKRYESLSVADLGPFQCVADAWDNDGDLESAVVSVLDLHLRKVREILKPDDDFIFGLAIGLGYFIPIEVLYLQRIRRELGLSIPSPVHPFLDQPMAKIPFPCPKSGYDPFIAKAYKLCRDAMPGLTIPWETNEQADESNTSWIEELDWASFRLPKAQSRN